MTELWTRWLLRCERTMGPRPLAWLRVLLPLCVIADLLRVVQLGLVDVVFLPYADGGLSRIQNSHLVILEWFGGSAGAIALGVTLVCMALTSLGVWMRPAIVVGVLAYAQLGHLYPPGDRAIDRLIRTALLILLFSDAHKALSWPTNMVQRIQAWPADLLRFLLMIVYVSAGMAKLIQQPGWLASTGSPPLLRILTDPMASTLDPVYWSAHPDLFRWGGYATIAVELSAPLLLTRYGHYWAIGGLLMHLGIASTMSLGMFGWGMLAFYPLLLAPFFVRPRDE